MRTSITTAATVPASKLTGSSLTIKRACVVLAGVFCLLMGTAQAAECGVQSPLLTDRGDDYYSLPEAVYRSRTDVSTLDTLLVTDSSVVDKLTSARFVRGHGQRTKCFGSAKNLRAETTEIELDEIHVLSGIASDRSAYSTVSTGTEWPGNIIIKAAEYDSHEKVVRRESIYFPLLNDGSTTTIGDTVLDTNSRRRHVGEQGSFLREGAITASLTTKGISVTEKIYVNGYLAEWLTWNLETR